MPLGIDGFSSATDKKSSVSPSRFADSAGPIAITSACPPTRVASYARAFRSPRARSSARSTIRRRRRHAVRQTLRGRARPERERKHVQIRERKPFDQRDRRRVIGLGLTWKAGDDVGAKSENAHRAASRSTPSA